MKYVRILIVDVDLRISQLIGDMMGILVGDDRKACNSQDLKKPAAGGSKLFYTKDIHNILGSLEFNWISDCEKAVELVSNSLMLGDPFALVMFNISKLSEEDSIEAFKKMEVADSHVQFVFHAGEQQSPEDLSPLLGDKNNYRIQFEPVRPFEFKQLVMGMTNKWYEDRKKDSLMANMRGAYQRAIAALHVKQELLNVVGHELRTPLNVITMTLDYFHEWDMEKGDLEMIEVSSKAAKRLGTIVDDVMLYVTIDKADFKFNTTPQSLANLIPELAKKHEDELKERNLKMVISIEDQLSGTFALDKKYFSYLLHSLIENALKFTNEGQISISAGLKKSEIDNMAKINIQVKDTGIGIEEEDCLEVFKLFFQVVESAKHSLPGTGMGLAICHRIVSLMGGKISVNSKLGEGSEFCIELELRRVTEVQ